MVSIRRGDGSSSELCSWSQAEADDESSSKFMGQYGKAAREAVGEDADHHGDHVQGMLDKYVHLVR